MIEQTGNSIILYGFYRARMTIYYKSRHKP